MNKAKSTYSVADIQRYLQGGMSNSEMQQLEMAALNDPFLQDALDGFDEAYSNYKPTEIEPALYAVETYEPSEPKKEAEAVLIPIWRRKLVQYAVASAVVLGTGWLIFNLSQPGNVVTSNKEVKQNAIDVTTDTAAAGQAVLPSIPQLKTTEPQQVVIKSNKQETKPINSLKIPPPEAQDAEVKNDDGVKDLATAKNDETTLNQVDSAREDVVVNKAPVPTPPSAVSKAFAPTSPATQLQGKVAGVDINEISANFVSGKVVDKEKYPLDNITLQLKGSRKAVLSDELGRFQIAIPDTTATLIASGPGYKSIEFKTNVNNKVELQLEPAAASLSEVVVMGYGARKKIRGTAIEMDTTEAAPAVGWKNFETYLLENKKMKSTGKKAVTVVLTFEVDASGRPGEFDIVQSGGVAFDTEAVRLLKAGPNWKNKTGDSTAMAKITIQF